MKKTPKKTAIAAAVLTVLTVIGINLRKHLQ